MNVKKVFEVSLSMVLCLGLMMVMAGCSSDSSDDSTNPTTPTTDSNLVINDALTNGKSDYGAANGGSFSAAGFTVNNGQGEYLAYSTTIQGNIRVEFDAIGSWSRAGEAIFLEIFDTSHNTSWAGGSSAWATNSLFQIMVSYPAFRVKRGGYNNYTHDWLGPFDWDSATNYHWVFSITNGSCQVTRNGQPMGAGSMMGYSPQAPLNIRIGGTWDPTWGSLAGITYSNVKVYKQ